MTNYREQAIRDVAAALDSTVSYVEFICGTPRRDYTNFPTAYAVAQRERVLKLEAQLQQKGERG